MREFWDSDEGHESYDDFDDSNDDDSTVACPHCGESIYEDAERCPACGSYLSDEDAPPSRKPWWIVITALVCLAVLYLTTVGLFPFARR